MSTSGMLAVVFEIQVLGMRLVATERIICDFRLCATPMSATATISSGYRFYCYNRTKSNYCYC